MEEAPSEEILQEEKLVTLWPDYKCLYDVRSKEFKDRSKRAQCIEDLAVKVNATADWVKQKLRSLRCTYTKSLSPSKSGSARKPQTKRNKWLCEKLQFLDPYIAKRKGSVDTLSSETSSEEEGSDDEAEKEDEETAAEASLSNSKTLEPPTKKKPLKVSQKKKTAKDDEELQLIKQIAESATRQKTEAVPDKFELFGQYVSSSLREFDDTTRHIVQHRISTVIFEAQMGAINRPQLHIPNSNVYAPTYDNHFFSNT